VPVIRNIRLGGIRRENTIPENVSVLLACRRRLALSADAYPCLSMKTGRMRFTSKLAAGLLAVLIVAATSGCSEASNGTTLKSARTLIRLWTAQVVADVGTTRMLGHSMKFIAVDSCGDWTSRYQLANLTVTVPFYKLQSAAQAVIEGQQALGWNTSAAHINVGGTGNLNGGTMWPAQAGSHAAMTVTGGPSPSGDADLQITITSDCFVG
jgi:hypothetical protein